MRGGFAALSAGCVLLIAMTAGSCNEPDEVEIDEVAHADVVELVETPAVVVATATAVLTAAADGTVAELLVRPGDEVAAGDVLAVVDSPPAQRRLARAEEALQAATLAAGGGVPGGGDLVATQEATDGAALEAFQLARDVAGRIADAELRDTLLAQVDAAQQRYAVAAAAAREAVRAVQRGAASLTSAVEAMGAARQMQTRQAYDLAELTVDALTLRAPFAGVVQLGGPAPGAAPGGASAGVTTQIAAGAAVTAGTPLLTVVDVSQPAVVAELAEADVLRVEPGLSAEVELLAAPGARYPATVTAVDALPTAGEEVAYRVRLILGSGREAGDAPAPAPRPGMTAVAHLEVAEAFGAVVVPTRAVMVVDGEESVWAVREGRAELAPVTVGVRGREAVQILAGLDAGERIVVGGVERVRAGQRLPP